MDATATIVLVIVLGVWAVWSVLAFAALLRALVLLDSLHRWLDEQIHPPTPPARVEAVPDRADESWPRARWHH